MDTSTSLANKYRPQTFGTLRGQEHAAFAIRAQVARGRVAPAYLFTGPRGTGKTTLARVLAAAMNCADRTSVGEPCTVCKSCKSISAGHTTTDVVEIDAASNRGVADAEALRERALYAASADNRTKVYIVDEAHMYTREAWNAMLKVVEEPPKGVVFIFATTEPQKIAQSAAPILSRVQQFEMQKQKPEVITALLRDVLSAEELEAEPGAVALVGQAANGSFRDGLTKLGQVHSFHDKLTEERVREILGLPPQAILAAAADVLLSADDTRLDKLMQYVQDKRSGAEVHQFFAGIADTIRHVGRLQAGDTMPDLSDKHRTALSKTAEKVTRDAVQTGIRVAAEHEVPIRRSQMPDLALHNFMLTCTETIREREAKLQARAQAAGVSAPAQAPGVPATAVPAAPASPARSGGR